MISVSLRGSGNTAKAALRSKVQAIRQRVAIPLNLENESKLLWLGNVFRHMLYGLLARKKNNSNNGQLVRMPTQNRYH